jgi:hypothetical protein
MSDTDLNDIGVYHNDARTVPFTAAEFGVVWAIHRGKVFQTHNLGPFLAEWRAWLAAHDAELTERVRAEQIEFDAGVVDQALADHVSQYAAVIAAAAIREAGKQ